MNSNGYAVRVLVSDVKGVVFSFAINKLSLMYFPARWVYSFNANFLELAMGNVISVGFVLYF